MTTTSVSITTTITPGRNTPSGLPLMGPDGSCVLKDGCLQIDCKTCPISTVSDCPTTASASWFEKNENLRLLLYIMIGIA